MANETLAGKRVLIAEDDMINQYVLRHSVKSVGAIAEVVETGHEAIEKIRQNHYHIVLMDVQMPGMNGLEATRYIRQKLKSKVPILGITAFALDKDLQKCLDAGMNDFLSKPYAVEILKTKMENLVNNNKDKKHKLQADDLVIDLGLVYEVAAGDVAFIKSMIEVFLKTMPVTLQTIKEANASSDWYGLYRAAHTAKSSLSIVQVGNMLDLVKQVEVSARKQEDLDKLSGWIMQVEEQYGKADRALRQAFFDNEPAPALEEPTQ